MKFYSTPLLVLSAIIIGVWGAPAIAANSISYVASVSSGAGNCSTIADACSDIQTALVNTQADGLITCVSGGTSNISTPLQITKSITIDCAATGHAARQIIIQAPNARVRLRGLTVDGFSVVTNLIDIEAAATVIIDQMSISNPAPPAGSFGTNCIKDVRTGPGKLFIRDTRIADCFGVGILIAPASGILTVALDGVSVFESNYALAVGSGGRVMIDHSTFSGNNTAGIEADGGAFVGVNNSLISSNNIGVQAGGTIALSNSDIKSNNTGISGATQSFGNNRFFANISDGTAPTPVSQR